MEDRIGTSRLLINCILRRKSSCQIHFSKMAGNKATDSGQQAVKRSYCYLLNSTSITSNAKEANLD